MTPVTFNSGPPLIRAHAVEWSPVPEPAAFILFAAGVLGLLGFRRGVRQSANFPGAA
jgi:hypothetical protein